MNVVLTEAQEESVNSHVVHIKEKYGHQIRTNRTNLNKILSQ